MTQLFETTLRPPPGVSFTQWSDGTIRIRYSTKDVLPIRKTLLDLARNLTDEALRKLKTDKDAELERQRLPLTRLQQINKDMVSLQTEMRSIETESVDLSALESTIEQRIKSVEVPIKPVIQEESTFENAPGVSVSTTIDVAEFED